MDLESKKDIGSLVRADLGTSSGRVAHTLQHPEGCFGVIPHQPIDFDVALLDVLVGKLTEIVYVVRWFDFVAIAICWLLAQETTLDQFVC